MKILYIDPSGLQDYAYGLTMALSKENDVTVVARDNYSTNFENSYKLYKWFRLSKTGKLNRVRKGIGYILAYTRIIILAVREKYEVIHINWFLALRFDVFFLKCLRKHCKNIVYTAHNIVPHIHGERYISQLTKIYGLVDKIVVHGNSLKNELIETFPTIKAEKIYVQHFGIDVRDFAYDKAQCTKEIVNKLEQYKGIHLLFFGNILNEKAVERVIKFWNRYASSYPQCILSVVGKVFETNQLYDAEKRLFMTIENKLFLELNSFMSMEDHNFLYSDADILVLPYRRASMSAVVKMAAAFNKTLISTDVGCIREYLENGVDSFVVPNNYESLEEGLLKVLNTMNKAELKKMGVNLHNGFYKKGNWDHIVKEELMPIYMRWDER